MNRISINEPCHENWAAMTPTQQGAFCGKCQIDVIDFSGKSAEEIKQILQQNAGKHLCGRFKKTQLEDINHTYLEWDNQNIKIFQSKFLYACLLVFGMTLFSCDASQDVMKELEPVRSELLTPENTNDQTIDQKTGSEFHHEEGSLNQDEWHHLKGKVSYEYYEQPQNNCIIPGDTVEEELMIKGEIAYVPEPEYMLGQMTVKSVPNPLMMPEKMPEDEPEIMPDNAAFSAQVFPNPGSELTTLNLTVKTEDRYSIELYTLDGKKIMDVFSGTLTEGQSTYRLDLSEYTSGTYLLVVRSDKQVETIQLVKT